MFLDTKRASAAKMHDVDGGKNNDSCDIIYLNIFYFPLYFTILASYGWWICNYCEVEHKCCDLNVYIVYFFIIFLYYMSSHSILNCV